ncbi:assimilatory sulfite reductase (NADPH) flavoprotein subunit [Thalassomonas viridans]|uniref:Sulfite reductase [NADPH] flavoprotein alpha-component n=1 Tax=Thalassomonas viridans TaxID=137584 RepID=A0AAE9Z218_9GAMM|nr:assimilatory sulfite reductase (NADPH) flavoprotein subunit [Thalassomonas viridans]
MLPKQRNLSQTMLDADQLASLQQTIGSYSPLQLAWASGYLAAKSEQSSVAVLPAAQAAVSSILTILYVSQTGNAKGVAQQLAQSAEAAGITVNLKNVADYKAKSLKAETHLLIVASTNGEGEAPDDGLEFHEFLLSKKAPKLPNLKYSVLALGDSSYEFFCQTGKDFDERLKALGATQVSPRVDCDVDYDADAKAWTTSIVDTLKEELTSSADALAPVVNLPVSNSGSSAYNKQSPYAAEFLVSQKITGRESAKDVRHIEIDLGESGLQYQPGDALGIWFENDGQLVDEILQLLAFAGDETVSFSKDDGEQTLAIRDALISVFEITQTAPPFVDFWAKTSGSAELLALAEDKNALREFAANHQLVDILKLAPAQVTPQELVDSLRKMTPRLYSIASSQAEVDEEVHLTVGLVSYERDGKTRLGGASGYLAQRLEEGDKVKIFVEHNDNFRLPENDDTPVIMIGPGTGVAPFRAFMQEREARDAGGDNWMFFGDQTFTQDFLYQVEWQNYLKSGLLTKMNVAFSRDQAEKIYVQDRLKEQAKEVFAWLERGAHLYVCGDANRMAKDVHNTLLEIIAQQGGLSAEQAEDYLKTLRVSKRYQKDVY